MSTAKRMPCTRIYNKDSIVRMIAMDATGTEKNPAVYTSSEICQCQEAIAPTVIPAKSVKLEAANQKYTLLFLLIKRAETNRLITLSEITTNLTNNKIANPSNTCTNSLKGKGL